MTTQPTTTVALDRASKLASCGKCNSYDIERQPGDATSGPMDKCKRCGHTFAHKPGTVTAEMTDADETSADENKPMWMSSDGKGRAIAFPMVSMQWDALTLGSDWKHPPRRNEQPCKYVWRESLPADKGFQDIARNKYKFSRADIKKVVEDYQRIKATGYEPYLPTSHTSKERNLGFVVDACQDPKTGSLQLLHQYIGDAAAIEAAQKKSSIMLLRDVEDAYGNKYEYVIEHDAVLPNPQLPDLNSYQPALAASRGPAIPAVQLIDDATAIPTAEIRQKAEEVMDFTPLRTGLALVLDRIPESQRGDLPALDAVKDDDLVLTASKIMALSTDRMDSLESYAIEAGKERDTAVEENQASQQQVLSLSKDRPTPATATELYCIRKAAEGAEKAAIEKGWITPAACASLRATICKKPVEFSSLSLSRDTQADDYKLRDALMLYVSVVEAMAGTPPPTRGDSKKIALAREVPDDKPMIDTPEYLADQRREAELATGMKIPVVSK